MYTYGFRINANLVKEGCFRINAKLVKEELKQLNLAAEYIISKRHITISQPFFLNHHRFKLCVRVEMKTPTNS